MLTRTVDRILIDHFKISKTALLIEGARQIGKHSQLDSLEKIQNLH